jgi:hypothetical protein
MSSHVAVNMLKQSIGSLALFRTHCCNKAIGHSVRNEDALKCKKAPLRTVYSLSEVSGSQGGEFEDCFLGCCAV